MVFGFLDESGDPAPEGGSKWLVVVILATEHPRLVAQQVKRMRRALGKRAPGELKARFTAPRVVERFMKMLALIDVFLFVVAVDKEQYRKADGEYLYRQAVARVTRHCVKQLPQAHLIFDKRYSNPNQRTELESVVRNTIADISGQVVLIEMIDSTSRPELQAVDFVAWAFWQKYERGDDRFARLLAARVFVEDVLK